MIANLIIGAIGSLIASALFLLLLLRFRPNLEISPSISKPTYDGQTIYSIKVVNRGSRDVVRLSAELLMVEPQVVKGGIGKKILQFALSKNEWFALTPTTEHDGEAAFEFITNEKIEFEWEQRPNSYLIFRVYAQDSLSGFTKVFSNKYFSKTDDIIVGRFGFGASMEISG